MKYFIMFFFGMPLLFYSVIFDINRAEFFSNPAVDLTSYLPKGYVTDGSIDYTSYIQQGINENNNILMPNFPMSINSKGLKLRTYSKIYFQNNSVIYMIPNDKSSYAIFHMNNVENIEIWNPKIVGDKYTHLSDKGEWGMGIQIRDSRNIKIFSPIISKCWGDGIYIGGEAKNGNNQIYIENAHINDCRRNGISITEGNNIKIVNPIIENIKGTSPQAGIDIEPNNSNSTIDNISIYNPITKNNGNFGIVISLGALPSNTEKNVNIRIDNHVDEKSHYAFCLAAFRGTYKNKKKITGLIQVNNSKWYNNKIPFTSANYDYAPMTIFNNVQIYKTNYKFENLKLVLKEQLYTEDIVNLKNRVNKKYKNIIFR